MRQSKAHMDLLNEIGDRCYWFYPIQNIISHEKDGSHKKRKPNKQKPTEWMLTF